MSEVKKETSVFRDNAFYIVFFLTGVIFLFIYKISLDFTPDGPNIFQYILKELAMAMIIAIMLVYSIERVTRQKHEKAANNWQLEANKNVLKAIYRRYIPEEVFSEVESCLLNSKVYRKDYSIFYKLRFMKPEEVKVSANEHFIAEVRSSYTLVNTTDAVVKHALVVNLEIPNESDFVQFTKINSVRITHGSSLDSSIDLIKEDNVVCTTAGGKCRFEEELEIPPFGEVKVQMEGQTAKRKIDNEVWSSRLPSTGIEVTVTTPDERVSVECNANNSSDIKQDPFKSVPPQTVWKLTNGLFPYQSVHIYWNGEDAKQSDVT